MIKVFKMVHNYYDVCTVVKLNYNNLNTTKGNKYKLQKSASHYNLRKFSFGSRVVNIWNSLPDSVVDADTLNTGLIKIFLQFLFRVNCFNLYVILQKIWAKRNTCARLFSLDWIDVCCVF